MTRILIIKWVCQDANMARILVIKWVCQDANMARILVIKWVCQDANMTRILVMELAAAICLLANNGIVSLAWISIRPWLVLCSLTRV